jgi:prepilin-type N-terminal cleavage/methylation domain-containing protein
MPAKRAVFAMRRSPSLTGEPAGLRRGVPDDDGFSLIEVVVSMTIMAIIGAIFTAGMVQVYRTVTGTDERWIAQGQVSQALMRLDREVRYASYIGATSPGRPYVEYQMMNDVTQQCVQLRIASTANGSQLQRRTWTQGQTPVVPTAWARLATGVTSAAPFTRIDPTDTLTHQQLRLVLTATADTTAKQSDVTYTALNTNQNSVSLATSGSGPTAEPCYTDATRT